MITGSNGLDQPTGAHVTPDYILKIEISLLIYAFEVKIFNTFVTGIPLAYILAIFSTRTQEYR